MKAIDLASRRVELKKKYFKKFSQRMEPIVVLTFFQLEHRLDLIIDLKDRNCRQSWSRHRERQGNNECHSEPRSGTTAFSASELQPTTSPGLRGIYMRDLHVQKEQQRLHEASKDGIPWRKWGPYLSERQWGTVREDYSEDGNAWDYFTHDQARSRAYHWGEDGLAGISDDKQFLCFALALWNGKDPILKERLFGLTNGEGNHGEDVKEYYFYLDSTPTHSYMKYLYKYPQAAYPYDDLIAPTRDATATNGI